MARSPARAAAPLASTAPAGTACPPEMAPVRDFCIDRWEGSLLEITPDGDRPFSPYQSPDGHVVRAVSMPGATPQSYVSRDGADLACKASGKRLCKEDEWAIACKGDPPRNFPYGDAREKGACNDDGLSPIPALFGTGPSAYGPLAMRDPRLNLQPHTLSPTGAHARCTNAFGVFDMVGNLHEWVMSERATFRGGFYQDATSNGPGCWYKTTAHTADYWDYSTGFRCCADAKR